MKVTPCCCSFLINNINEIVWSGEDPGRQVWLNGSSLFLSSFPSAVSKLFKQIGVFLLCKCWLKFGFGIRWSILVCNLALFHLLKLILRVFFTTILFLLRDFTDLKALVVPINWQI